MDNSTKILIGSVVTALFSFGAHFIGSTGSSFVNTLEETAKYEISNAGIEGVKVQFNREPTITRDVTLSGDISEDKRNKALSIVEGISGVGSVRWLDEASKADDDNADSGGAGNAKDANNDSTSSENAEPADRAVVAKCQSDINNITEGKNINFRSGSFYVPPSSYGLLDEIVAAIQPCVGVKLEVQGHTDLMGSPTLNQTLSEGRAESVRDELIKRGLDANRVRAKGYGSTKPIENARTSSANAKNRRTIFIIS